ncbi:MAG: cyclic pyranopterin monophosphate synthase MoaC [Bacteroidales bacterium]
MELTHVNQDGKANMVDISGKPDQIRTARAEGYITLQPETIRRVTENTIKKGDVIATARIAGIMAAKQTHLLIPLCHPLPISKIEVELGLAATGIQVTATVACIGKTGVEMEALTAVQITLLTIYDMCKAVDKQMVMERIQLVEKTKQ